MRSTNPVPPKLDPWATSSLLQKAIRRSESDLACHAARELHRYRGKGVFRRLVNIAFEDVGIADPDLVSETVFLAFEPMARAALGSDLELIEHLTRRMALAPKDRSADYLFCAAIKSAEGRAERTRLEGRHPIELIAIAADPETALVTRAAAVLLACTRDDKLVSQPTSRLLTEIERHVPGALLGAVDIAARHRLASYVAMLPLLWSALSKSATSDVLSENAPRTSMIGGVPAYTFDKHTAVGKRAIASFACQNPQMAEALEVVSPDQRRDVALMAAFYADGVPTSLRFLWDQSQELEQLGLAADMGKAGCPCDAIYPVLDCVRANLPNLDRARRDALRNSLSIKVVQSIAKLPDRPVS